MKSFFCFNYQGDIAIDDIERLTVSCKEPNDCDFEGDTFLIVASLGNNVNMIKLLLNNNKFLANLLKFYIY